jgi:hypothetical protein
MVARSGRCAAQLERLENRRLLAAMTYSVVDLGPSPSSTGYDIEAPSRVNKSYVSGGYYNNSFQLRAFRSDNAIKKAIDLPPVKFSTEAAATDLTETGIVVGISYNGTSHTATKWVKGSPTNLGSGEATAISNNGKYIVGTRQLAGESIAEDRAVIYAPTPKTLGTLGGTGSHANDVNNSGLVVGQASNKFGQPMPFVYDGSKMVQISGGQDLGEAFAINNSGQVVGELASEAFSYDSKTRKLTMLSPAAVKNATGSSTALDINGAGQIVGFTNTASGSAATVWNGAAPSDLNKLISSKSGWTLDYAKSIDDQGQILGTGFFKGESHAFLLKPQRASLASNGMLTITGSVSADSVSISVNGAKLNIVINGTAQSFTRSSVKRISIDLASGDDSLGVGTSAPPVNVKAGNGNDTLNLRNGVKDVVDGGSGKDKAKLDGADSKTGIETLLA